jgi:hypothetical protein
LTLPDPNAPGMESLRVTFDVQTSIMPGPGSVPWYAEISIYNLNEGTANFLLTQGSNSGANPSANSGQQGLQMQQGMEVTLSAGYQSPGRYGIIWDGYVLQPLWDRENQTDLKLTLHCMNWLGLASANSVVKYFPNGYNLWQIIKGIADSSYHQIGVGTVSQTLANTSLPRGKAVFGNPDKYLREIARSSNMQFWLQSKGLLNFGGLSDPKLPINTQNPRVYTPTTGIIGTPQQWSSGNGGSGVNFRVLLDPTVQVTMPATCVKIDNTQIRQQLIQAGVFPGILAQDGTYAIVGARYLGDTRGQNWYTDVNGWTVVGELLGALASGQAVQIGNG